MSLGSDVEFAAADSYKTTALPIELDGARLLSIFATSVPSGERQVIGLGRPGNRFSSDDLPCPLVLAVKSPDRWPNRDGYVHRILIGARIRPELVTEGLSHGRAEILNARRGPRCGEDVRCFRVVLVGLTSDLQRIDAVDRSRHFLEHFSVRDAHLTSVAAVAHIAERTDAQDSPPLDKRADALY